MKASPVKSVLKRRLKPYQVALCVLLAGWVPSLLLAYYYSAALSRTLEAKQTDDAESLVASLARHVENELARTGETLDYYRTLPVTAALLAPNPVAPASGPHRSGRAAPAPPGTQPVRPPPPPGPPPETGRGTPPPALLTAPEWLAGVFYPQVKRIDGMFLAGEDRIIAAVPALAGAPPRPDEAPSTPWKNLPEAPGLGFSLSPAHPRPQDGRMVVTLVATVRDPAGAALGYLGADMLVERMARRLHAADLPGAGVQIFDQDGHPLFAGPFQASLPGQGGTPPELRQAFARGKTGVREINGRMCFFAPVGALGWTALTEQPALAFHAPVRELRRETALLTGLLAAGTAVAAALLAALYRRQLQSSLRVEQAQLFSEKILANLPVGIALVDPAGQRVLQSNEAFADLAAALGGVGPHEVMSHVPFARTRVASQEALARVLGFGVPYQTVEQRTTLANGQTRFLTTNLLRLQDSAQRTLGALCLVEDNTAAVTLREELIRAGESKDQFLAQLSHELRNPLSPVLTMVAELEVVADGLPATRQPLEVIRRNVELEARLIDDLLDVTRISQGKLQLHRQRTDVFRTLRLALEICQRDADEKRLRLELDLRAAEHHTEADPARLQQVFWNLLKNAVKFTPEGRRIAVRAFNLPAGAPGTPPGAAREAAVAAEHGANGHARPALRVEFTDEGIGIENQNLRRIFNAFDQGQASITQRFGGLGLGLAISKAMVEAHGGTLAVSSEGLNRGATFTVDLTTCPAPAAGEDAPAASGPAHRPTAAETAATGAGRHILLVDDHLDTCLGMTRLLQRRGFRVAVAHCVSDALLKAEGERFDLLISDLGLPDGTGFDLMAELQRRGGPPGIALSGFGMEGDLVKSREAGFREHLTKPVAIERLDEAIRSLLKDEG